MRYTKFILAALFLTGLTHQAYGADLTCPIFLLPSVNEPLLQDGQLHIAADNSSGQLDDEYHLDSNVVLTYNKAWLQTDKLIYSRRTNNAHLPSSFSALYDDNFFSAANGNYNIISSNGEFNNAFYRLAAGSGLGQADKIKLHNAKQFSVYNTKFSTCEKTSDIWQPDWYLQAKKINVDLNTNTAYAYHSTFRFKNVPLFYLPYISVPLDKRRRTGFLSPYFANDSTSGFEVGIPFYWNIAPNYDNTTVISALTKRGVNLANTFRFLTPNHRGSITANLLPNDKINHRNRWSYLAEHSGTLFNLAQQPVTITTHFNAVSDNNYWSDALFLPDEFQRRTLNHNVSLAWRKNNFAANLLWQRWKILKNANETYLPPYNLEPQLHLSYSLPYSSPWIVNANLISSRFTSAEEQLKPQAATRLVSLAELGYKWGNSWSFVNTSASWQHNRYRLKNSLPNQQDSTSFTSTTLRLDSGLIFTRHFNWKERSFYQLLRPRLVYIYTPNKQPNNLTAYDSAAVDFNFDSIFASRQYSGYDIIPKTNLVTVGFNSTIFSDQQNSELLAFNLAQQFNLTDNYTSYRDSATDDTFNRRRYSDLLTGLRFNLKDNIKLSLATQYNFNDNKFINKNIALRYQPQNDRFIEASYSKQNVIVKKTQLAAKWPLHNDGAQAWYAIGSVDYDLLEKKISKSLFGVEYNSCCWAASLSLETKPAWNGRQNKRLLLQLSLKGFGTLGN